VIPLYDNVPTRGRPVVTVALIAINAVVFLFMLVAPNPHLKTTGGRSFEVQAQTAITEEFGFIPCEVRNQCRLGDDRADFGANAPFVIPHVPVAVTAVTSMFLHGGWAHLIFNMLFLWIFGNNVEDRLGRVRFLVFYLLGGLAALTLQYLVDPSSDVVTIGASGAIAAVLAGYMMMYPRALIITLIGWFPVPIPAFIFLAIWAGLQALGAAEGFHALTGGGGGVAYFAHIGGFVFGLATIRLFDRGRRPGLRYG
jgi:membrane associated rhomboid family serine protease